MSSIFFRFRGKERAARGLAIGLYGGTFDPPHAGHVHVAETALAAAGLDQIWWLVSPQNPLKARAAPPVEDRMNAARRLARNPRMVVSDLEDRIAARYTIQTIEHLRARAPGVRFILVIGGDSFDNLQRWRRWTDIVRTVPILIVARPGYGLKGRLGPAARRFAGARIPEYAAKTLKTKSGRAWTYVTARWRAVSSTQMREQRKKNKP
jgi:nicotinate-nucleotide adenylyltransferase